MKHNNAINILLKEYYEIKTLIEKNGKEYTKLNHEITKVTEKYQEYASQQQSILDAIYKLDPDFEINRE